MYHVGQWLGNVRFSWGSFNISVGFFPSGYNGGLHEVGHSPPAQGYVNCGWSSLNIFNMRCGLLKMTQCEMDLGGMEEGGVKRPTLLNRPDAATARYV